MIIAATHIEQQRLTDTRKCHELVIWTTLDNKNTLTPIDVPNSICDSESGYIIKIVIPSCTSNELTPAQQSCGNNSPDTWCHLFTGNNKILVYRSTTETRQRKKCVLAKKEQPRTNKRLERIDPSNWRINIFSEVEYRCLDTTHGCLHNP